MHCFVLNHDYDSDDEDEEEVTSTGHSPLANQTTCLVALIGQTNDIS
jgi:hypothetical protein